MQFEFRKTSDNEFAELVEIATLDDLVAFVNSQPETRGKPGYRYPLILFVEGDSVVIERYDDYRE